MWQRRPRRRKDGAWARENHWHTYLMTAYSDAAWRWWQVAEETTYLYEAELETYAEEHPRPLLKDFMVRLGREWQDRGAVA